MPVADDLRAAVPTREERRTIEVLPDIFILPREKYDEYIAIYSSSDRESIAAGTLVPRFKDRPVYPDDKVTVVS